jgi:hypothetical protein
VTCAACRQRPAPVSGKTSLCALCRRDVRRENEALSRAIWGALWKQRREQETTT